MGKSLLKVLNYEPCTLLQELSKPARFIFLSSCIVIEECTVMDNIQQIADAVQKGL